MNQLEWILLGVLVFVVLIIVVNILDNLFTGRESFLLRLFRRKRRRSSQRFSYHAGGATHRHAANRHDEHGRETHERRERSDNRHEREHR